VAESQKIVLTVDMIHKVQSLFDRLYPQDINLEVFKNFETETLQVGNILDSIQVERFANESAKLLTHCKNYAAVVYAFVGEANRRYKKAKAKVFLYDAEAKWDTLGKKKAITDKAKDAFIGESDAVNEIVAQVIQWEALDKWFSDTYRDIENKHNWYKKLFDRVVRNNKD